MTTGASPGPALGLATQPIAIPAVVCGALVILALLLLWKLDGAKDRLKLANHRANRRAVRMCETIRTIRMIEAVAGVGVWEYDRTTGEQKWSTGMRTLFGVDHDEPFVEGDAETLLRANDIDLIGSVATHWEEHETFALQFDAYGFDGVRRSLRGAACNMRFRGGRADSVVAVLRDVTEQLDREKELESSREEAMREAVQARELAATDALTGLANRRKVMERLDLLVLEARRNATPLSMVVFDIDHFKLVNDTYGHLEGDKILKKVAAISQDQSREDDIVGRVGGEEFVWLIPGAGEAVAARLAERLRASVERDSATDIVPAVTMSVGYAELASGDSSLTLFARADGALYDAKKSGRNRVALAA